MSGAEGWRDSARRIAPLAWPVFVGQVSVLGFGTIDTIFVARFAAGDLAALAVGAAAYITVFIGFMGVLMALSPIVGQLHGAGRHADAGRQLHQALWLGVALALLGCALLAFPAPFLALARATPEVAERVRGYLLALAFSLPASLLFTLFRAFNTAVSRPKVVMAIQLGGLAAKVPLSAALVFGVPALGVPALGVVGCGLATAIAMWLQVLLAWRVLRRDAFYDRYALWGRGLDRPARAPLLAQLRLGVPLGLSILVEVTGFAFMALFIARLGTTAVAGHQLAVNLVSLMFMVPLAIGNAGSTLVAQAVGAGRHAEAARLGWHALALGTLLAVAMGLLVFALRRPVLGLYTGDAAVLAAALPLVAWLAVFHAADAAQTIAAFVLRAYKITVVSVVIYVAALWGVGLGGGYWLAFDVGGHTPPALRGAPGYWFASTAGLVVAAVALAAVLGWVLRRSRGAPPAG
ncbi:MAG: MATE family efflux transporter [Burkholderiaceae bacterium]|nr:MATE family efflux transporter [Burkholderiaceae bacterium]MCZ8176098.1 MATE family efflux transporter [Burkholderiaceae bacterium]